MRQGKAWLCLLEDMVDQAISCLSLHTKERAFSAETGLPLQHFLCRFLGVLKVHGKLNMQYTT